VRIDWTQHVPCNHDTVMVNQQCFASSQCLIRPAGLLKLLNNGASKIRLSLVGRAVLCLCQVES
jgi:hypothetical protein